MVLFRSGGDFVAWQGRLPYRPSVLFGDGDGHGGLERLLDETRDLLCEAGIVVDGSIGSRSAGSAAESATILKLYDELRQRLDHVDDARLTTLLTRISTSIERLGRLDREVSRIRTLRERIGAL